MPNTTYLTEPAWREIPCRCTHPADYHRDTYHGDPCTHWLCDCCTYNPAEDDMLDNTDTLAGYAVLTVALAVMLAAAIAVLWAVSRP